MLKNYLFLFAALIAGNSFSQCDSVQVNGDLIISSNETMSGTYVIDGDFTVESGVTVFVTPYSSNGCGELKIYATNITIDGTIDGDNAGFEGGNGGLRGFTVTSSTGHESALIGCDSSDDSGEITLEEGKKGDDGNGPGAGLAGTDATTGSGTKQNCGNFDDEAGIIGSPGGAGGGAGGSYGGAAQIGGNGGNGNNIAYQDNVSIQSDYSIVAGQAGTGGTIGQIYGSDNGRDIELGSGGAGAGGGGRSTFLGGDGQKGGNGGGLIFLQSLNNTNIAGIISVKGENGSNGGNGGQGGSSEDCCSDGCSGCDEKTHAAGAGAGGGSGAGSGGGIFIEANNIDISGELISTGGEGGNGGTAGIGASCSDDGGVCSSQTLTVSDGEVGSKGGSGSGGRIKVYAPDCANISVTGTAFVEGGNGANSGTYAEVCGYAGLNKIENSIGWNIFPNPTNGTITISILSGVTIENGYQLRVFDLFGNIVSEQKENSTTTFVDLSDLSNGIYYVQILAGTSVETKKIVKK